MATSLFVNARDFAKSSNDLVEKIGMSGETCYITEDGRAKAVLIDIQHYNNLMDLLEESEQPEPMPESADFSVRHILENSSRQ